MWLAAKIPAGLVIVVLFLAVIGAKKVLQELGLEEDDGYRTEWTAFGKVFLGFLFGISILFATALLLLFVVVLLRA
jgi:uncharacterized membrane protein